VINCAVNKSKQLAILKIRIFTKTSMPRLHQNDRERAVGMVQAGMTHQAVADYFNVSRITISRLMIRLRQTGRTKYRPRNGRIRITSVFFLGRHYHRICHQLNIYRMNSVDVFATIKIHWKHYRSCVTLLCTSGTTS
jgi:hypothetical protein